MAAGMGTRLHPPNTSNMNEALRGFGLNGAFLASEASDQFLLAHQQFNEIWGWPKIDAFVLWQGSQQFFGVNFCIKQVSK